MTDREQRLQSLLADARHTLWLMGQENRESRNPFRQRWPYHHEPLRADARGLVKRIDAEIFPSCRPKGWKP